ncbi:MAG: PIN domain-containing protein [Archangium sp.]
MKRTVLVDTGPLVALLDTRDGLHDRAMRELKLLRGELKVEVPVLVEAHLFLQSKALRARVVEAFARGSFILGDAGVAERTRYALQWLERYAEHAPDFADGWVVAAADVERAAVWTFDSEFKSVWRTLSGKRIKLVP